MSEAFIQSYQQQEFPAFPVIFQPEAQVTAPNKQSKPYESGPFRKFPQQQLNILKEHLLNLPQFDTRYAFLWTEELTKIEVNQFVNELYRPFDEEFIDQFKQLLPQVKMCRIGQHKVYVGQVKDNMCSGLGIILLKNGTVYEGQLLQNKRHGKGVHFDSNLGYYKGIFKHDIKEGQGLEVLQNKILYSGPFLNNLRHGSNGFYVDLQQNQYYGEWKLGIMHGKGFLKSKTSIYYGVFVNWLKHGQGQERFLEGDSYKGEYQNGRLDGFGTYRWSNGAVYEGSFRNGLRHGKGKWSQNETKYLGNYIEGLKEGYGELYFPSGNFYKGNFVNDLRQGYGEMFWTDGSFYKGEWKNGIQNGKGQIYLSGNEIMSGVFENSILVQMMPPFVEKGPLEQQSMEEQTYQTNEPRGLPRTRTYSESKNISYNKRLTRIDQNVRKPQQHSAVKNKMYFKSPQRTDHSNSRGKQNLTHHHEGHSHGHGGRECKCVKRLQNFRLKQQVRRVDGSRFVGNPN